MFNFTFEIVDFVTADERLARGLHPDHLISITAYDFPTSLDSFRGNLLPLQFHDIPLRRTAHRHRYSSNFQAPQKSHVQAIVDFAKTVDKGHLLVHCRAGISRSSAATLIVMAVHSGPEHADKLMELVRRNRSIARPNDLMLEYADEILGWGGELQKLGGWKNANIPSMELF
jgi:predicted protein tyrosine phosphatase